MTKKVVTVYGMLFLFAFTFALSFTLATSAQAGEQCCLRYNCGAEYPDYISEIGHWQVGAGCVFDGSDGCDIAFLCPG